MQDQPIILFDGVCNFCNNIVNFIIKRNSKVIIYFAALQSETGKKLLQHHNLPLNKLQTIIFIENGTLYTQSTAALRVCRYLSMPWPLCYAFIIVPKSIRDGIYNWVASNRYKWFGVRKECMVPGPDIKERFL